MLLDPHHQLSASGFRSIHRTGAQSRYRQSRHPHLVSDAMEDVQETSIVEGSPKVPVSSGRTGEESIAAVATSDNNLEGSWRINLAGEADDSDNVEEGDEVEAVVGGAGVLGLIHQFQKVSNDDRASGATVGI
jgi:autophagy-related protein 9